MTRTIDGNWREFDGNNREINKKRLENAANFDVNWTSKHDKRLTKDDAVSPLWIKNLLKDYCDGFVSVLI